MRGGKARRFPLLPSVTLEEVVPAAHFDRHLDRHLDRVLDLSFVRDLVQNCYAAGMGRPSVDPVVFSNASWSCSLKGSAPNARSSAWRRTDSVCAGTSATISMRRCPTIRV